MAKNTAGGPLTHLPWAGKRVRVEDVDQILSSLWRMSADNMRTGANLHVRTSVLNLVICTPDSESARYASKILRDLSSTHLARVAIAIVDTSSLTTDSIDSWVTLRCFSMISDLMRHCFEQTTLLISGNAAQSLNGTLTRILKAHLPTYLWWIGDTQGTDDTIFQNVAELCQRVIVDSATFFQPEQDIPLLAQYYQKNPSVALSDLNWGRLAKWCELVAQFFDVPASLSFLSDIATIEITHAAAPLATPSISARGDVSLNPTGALLLAGWLKARLNLQLVETDTPNLHDTASGSYQWTLEQADNAQQIQLHVSPLVQSNLPPGSIAMVRLTCNSGGQQAIFTVQRDTSSDHVLTSVELPHEKRLSRSVNLPARYDPVQLLRNELEIMTRDEYFEQTLQEVELLLNSKQ